jgi:hypothetical protein
MGGNKLNKNIQSGDPNADGDGEPTPMAARLLPSSLVNLLSTFRDHVPILHLS